MKVIGAIAVWVVLILIVTEIANFRRAQRGAKMGTPRRGLVS